MPSTPVLMADLPLMLEDIIGSVLERCGEFRVVRRHGVRGQLLQAARASGTRFIVVASDSPADLETIDPWLATASDLAVLTVAPDGGAACLHRINSTAESLHDASAEDVLVALRAVLAGRGG